MIPELKYDHVIKEGREHSIVEKHVLHNSVEHIDITIEADNSWVNIFDGYDRENVEYVNISLLNVWIRIPIKTLEEILKKGSAFINEHNHSQQEQDLVSEVD
jgi:hypothetical protein